jgi:Na+/melibiose symporter-like transporter
MFPEQSQTHKNREKVASVGTFLTIIASILALLFPLIIQSMIKDPRNVKWWEPSGKLIIFYIPLIGLGFAIFGVFSLILTFFSINEGFHKTSFDYSVNKISIWSTFQQMIIPAKDKKFRKFLMVTFFTSISGQILGILVIPFLTYSLKFRGNEFFIYVIVSIFCKFGWYYLWKKVLKNRPIIKTYALCLLSSIIASFLELVFLIEVLSFEFKIIIFIMSMGTILGSIYAAGLFSAPLASVLVYESATENKNENIDKAISKISGAYFGLNLFLAYIARTFGSIMIGIILSGSNQENPAIITISLSSMGIFFLIGFIFLRKIDVNEDILKSKPGTIK